MTRQQIEAMPAGREMDGLIAAKLFGHVGIGYYAPPDHEPYAHIQSVRHDTAEQAEAAYRAWWAKYRPGKPFRDAGLDSQLCRWNDGWGPVAVPEYSEHIDAAWEVVETDDADGKGKRWYYELDPVICGGWIVSVHDEQACVSGGDSHPPHLQGIYADTAPLAICRAAMLASLLDATTGDVLPETT